MAASLQTRFQILDRPLRHPGKCAVCGSATKPVVDMGITIPGYGVAYFCVEDIIDLGSAVGMVSESEVSELRLAAEQSFFEYLKTHNLKVVSDEWYYTVSSALSSLSAAVDNTRFHYGDPSVESAGTEVPEDAGQHDDDAHDSTDSDEPVAEQDDNAPVDKRSDSVSGDSGNGEPAGFDF